MTDTLRTRIAAVHQAHRWGVFRCDDGYARTCCHCQWREIADGPTHAEHVADAVIRELEADYVLVPKSQTLAKASEKALPGHKIVVTKTRSDEKQSLVCQCRWETNWGTENETRTEYSLHLIEARKAFRYGENYGI